MFNSTIVKNCYKKAIFSESKTLYRYIEYRGLINMRKITKKLSAIALCAMFASMQVTLAAGLSDASINHVDGGFKGSVAGNNSLDLNFNGNAHVNWDRLNVGKNESLNFNAVDGAKDLTILNTVNNGMTNVYGTISANSGISKLIISNPNGVLFDGASFTTAGDTLITTQAMGANFVNGNMDITKLQEATVNGVVIKNNSNFNVGGEFTIMAPSINAVKSAIRADKGVKLITANGQDFLVAPAEGTTIKDAGVRMETIEVDGNVYVLSGKDVVKVVNGGTINGDLTVESKGIVALNYVNDAKNTLDIKGNLKVNSTGDMNPNNKGNFMYLRNAKVGGNVDMANSGGFLEVGNLTAGGDVKLTTTAGANSHVKHFVHVIGDNDIKGNLTVDSIHNIHIGGYNYEEGKLANGSLKVGKNLTATAHEGSIAVSIDTSADKVALTSGTLNIISDGKANITANEYQFKANGYIGGMDTTENLINTMEGYKLIPPAKKTFLNIEGGKVTKLETADNGFAFVRANKDMDINGVKAGKVNLSAGGDIKIGKDAHADLIKVDGETRNLTVELPSRDYTLKYTNIKDTEEITINPETKITYEMANGENGWNKGTQTKENTYLVVPGEDPVGPIPPEDNDNVKVLNNLQRDQINAAIDANEVYSPIAFAADLDEDEDTGVRKNVDGSVTVVRAFPSK